MPYTSVRPGGLGDGPGGKTFEIVAGKPGETVDWGRFFSVLKPDR